MAWVLKGEGVWMVEDGKLVLGGAWGPWSLEGRGFGGLESGALGPGGAPGEAAGYGSLEGGCSHLVDTNQFLETWSGDWPSHFKPFSSNFKELRSITTALGLLGTRCAK